MSLINNYCWTLILLSVIILVRFVALNVLWLLPSSMQPFHRAWWKNECVDKFYVPSKFFLLIIVGGFWQVSATKIHFQHVMVKLVAVRSAVFYFELFFQLALWPEPVSPDLIVAISFSNRARFGCLSSKKYDLIWNRFNILLVIDWILHKSYIHVRKVKFSYTFFSNFFYWYFFVRTIYVVVKNRNFNFYSFIFNQFKLTSCRAVWIKLNDFYEL